MARRQPAIEPRFPHMTDHKEMLVGVQARIEDAGILADNGRYEGALLMLLVAVAATSRKRYPKGTSSKTAAGKKMDDREAFTTFLRDEMWRLVKEHDDQVVFRSATLPIEEFLYRSLRCELVHEGGIPIDLQPVTNEAVLSIVDADGSGISVSRLLLGRLNDVVWRVPENSVDAVRREVREVGRQDNDAIK
jgi:hypothetical protein